MLDISREHTAKCCKVVGTFGALLDTLATETVTGRANGTPNWAHWTTMCISNLSLGYSVLKLVKKSVKATGVSCFYTVIQTFDTLLSQLLFLWRYQRRSIAEYGLL